MGSMAKFFDRVGMLVGETGDAQSISLGSALTGERSFSDAGVADNTWLRYVIDDGSATEEGWGYPTDSGTKFFRAVVTRSTNSGSRISASSNARVKVEVSAEDLPSIPDRINQMLDGILLSDILAAPLTLPGRLADGFLAATGINAGASSNYSRSGGKVANSRNYGDTSNTDVIDVVTTWSGHDTSNGTAQRDFTITLGSACDALIICTGHRASAGTTTDSVSVNGNPATLAGRKTATASFQGAAIWYITGAFGAGTHTVSLTPSATISGCAITVLGLDCPSTIVPLFYGFEITNTNNHNSTWDMTRGSLAVRSIFNVPASTQSATWTGGTEVSDQWTTDDVAFHYTAGYYEAADDEFGHVFNGTITGNNNSVSFGTVFVPASFTSSGNDIFTKLLLKGDGTDGSVSILDSSPVPHTVTVSGDAQIDTAQSKFGGSSILFDGSGDFLNLDGSSDYAFGLGDFTIDFWLRLNSVTGTQILVDFRPAATQGAYPTLYISGTGLVYWQSSASRITGGTLSTSTWYHIALTRAAGQTKLFVDGTQVGSTYTDTTVSYLVGASTPLIGTYGATNYLNGWIDELRISKGIARWTANFTPPSSAYSNPPKNLTLISASQTLPSSRSRAHALIDYQAIDSITLNTDVTLELSCDGGANWHAASLIAAGVGQDGRALARTNDIICTDGTSLAARLKTLNTKAVDFHGLALKAV